jgi:hypothetical protein
MDLIRSIVLAGALLFTTSPAWAADQTSRILAVSTGSWKSELYYLA